MPSDTSSNLHTFIRKLETIHCLTDEERRAIAALPVHVHKLRSDHDMVRVGDRPSQCCLLLEGFAHRYQDLGDGRRQIMSFHIPGDMPDLLGLHLPVMDHNIGTLAPSKVGFISHQAMRVLTRNHPRVGDACWRDTLVDAAVFREWMVGMGRRSAYTRIAHLICELVTRLRSVGLADGNSVRLPLTQAVVSDALGLSPVHVNRVIQGLRGNGLITWQGRVLTVQNWEGLQQAGEFDPAYLHLQQGEAA